VFEWVGWTMIVSDFGSIDYSSGLVFCSFGDTEWVKGTHENNNPSFRIRLRQFLESLRNTITPLQRPLICSRSKTTRTPKNRTHRSDSTPR
jgi:hypothetical protein